jgi:hypothetical protein
VLYSGNPDRAVQELKDKIFSKEISQTELPDYQKKYNVISTQLKTGRLHIRILQETAPVDGFSPTDANLEDVYFSNIATRVDVNTI